MRNIVGILAIVAVVCVVIYREISLKSFLAQNEAIWKADEVLVQVLNEDPKKLVGEECTKLIENIDPIIGINSLKKDIKKCEPQKYATIAFYSNQQKEGELSVIKLSNTSNESKELKDFIYIIDGNHCVLKLGSYYGGCGKQQTISFYL